MKIKSKKQSNLSIKSKKSSNFQVFFENHFKMLVILIITISILMIYLKITEFNFTGFDDSTIIDRYRNYFKNNGNIWRIFTYFPLSLFYRPFLSLSFLIDINLSDSLSVFYISNIVFQINL